jgi:excisionase family DNA binding protein
VTPLLVTAKELAPMLGCSWRHVLTLRDQRLIPYVRLGRLVRYNPEEVRQAIERLTIREQGHESLKIPRSYRRRLHSL